MFYRYCNSGTIQDLGMTNRHTITITAVTEVNRALNWVDKMACKGLEGGAVSVDVYRYESDRGSEANKKIHAMYSDLQTQAVIKLPGNRVTLKDYDAEALKTLLVLWYARERELMGEPLRHPGRTIICPITGDKISIRPSTTQFTKKEMSGHIEWLYALGAECGVRWSEKSLECYQEYRQAQ